MIVSFTGTRDGMTPAQKITVLQRLIKHAPQVVSHGDCTGADEEFHGLALRAGVRQFIIRPGHGRNGETPTRAHCATRQQVQGVQCHVAEPKPYLVRDAEIAVEGNLLMATPKQVKEQWRGSGTWATIRMAYKRDSPTEIVFPDGSVGQYQPNQWWAK